mgnify:CR=1 FL=1
MATTYSKVKKSYNELGIIRMGMVKNRYGQNYGTTAMSIDYTTLTLSQTQQIIDTDEANAAEIRPGAEGLLALTGKRVKLRRKEV